MRNRQLLTAIVFAGLLTTCKPANKERTAPQDDSLRIPAKELAAGTHKLQTHYEVLAKLKEGNYRFVKKLLPSNLSHDSSYNYYDQILHSSTEQHPMACVLACMDSRVPPEIIFDQGIGSLFVIRVAGNIEDPDVLGSMEYAVAEKGVPLIVVLGHKNCGAIGAAFGKVDPANKDLASLIAHVKLDVVPADKPPYEASSKHNVKKTIENILQQSETIRQKQKEGKLVIVGGLYDVSNGTIDWNDAGW